MAHAPTAQTCATARPTGQGGDPLCGRIVAGRYRVDAVLARGGMATVYRATQLALARPVALKLCEAPALAGVSGADRFAREAAVAARVSHPHCVAVLDVGELAPGRPYLVMELLHGETLAAHLAATGPLPPARALSLAGQLAAALAAVHAEGAIHRDLKPANVLLLAPPAAPDFIKLLDFGLARMQADAEATHAGTMLGSPAYMAPEQVRGAPVDARTDVYALGAVLYEMLAGAPPFCHPTAVGTMMAHVDQPAPSLPPAIAAAVPAGVAALLARCLAKDPRARFADMAAVGAALAAAASAAPLDWDAAAEGVSTLAVAASPRHGPSTDGHGDGTGADAAPARGDAPREVTHALSRVAAPVRRIPSPARVVPAALSGASASQTRATRPAVRHHGGGDVGRAQDGGRFGRRAAALAVWATALLLICVAPARMWLPLLRPAPAAARRPGVRLHLDSSPRGAQVFVDGALLCQRTPCILHVRGESARTGRVLQLRFVHAAYDDYLATRVIAGRDLTVQAPLTGAG